MAPSDRSTSPGPAPAASPARAPRRWRRRILIALGAVLTLYLAAVLGLQRLLVFPRFAAPPDPRAGQDVPGLLRLTLDTDDGEVEGWLLPGDGVSAEAPGPAVIFTHGNAELIDYWAEPLAEYRRMGVTVLLPEYRGYGRSAGSPSESAITEDLVRFHDLLVERPEVDATRVVYHGRSLGGGAATALAARRRPAAMILQSTFRSVAVLARRYLMPRFLVLDPFDNEAVIPGLGDLPLLIIHGRQDSLIPVSHARTLAGLSRHSRLVLYDADHNDCPPDWDRFWRDVRDFLDDTGIVEEAR